MTRHFRFSLAVSAMAFAAISSGCGPGAGDGFAVTDALGQYGVTLDQSVALASTYNSQTLPVKATVTLADLGAGLSSVTGVSVVYDAATNLFTVTLSSGSSSTDTTIVIDGSAVKAIDSSDSAVTFSATAKNLKSITLTIPVGGAATVKSVATGCEQDLNEVLTLVLTADGIDGTIVAAEGYTTVGYSGTDPYVSCADWLAGIESVLRSGGTDLTGSGLTPYVINGGIDINLMSDLATFSETLHLSGKKLVVASKQLVIQSGPIVSLKLSKLAK